MLVYTKANPLASCTKGQGCVGGAQGAEEKQDGLESPLLGWELSSMQARVTFKKAFRFAGDKITHL